VMNALTCLRTVYASGVIRYDALGRINASLY